MRVQRTYGPWLRFNLASGRTISVKVGGERMKAIHDAYQLLSELAELGAVVELSQLSPAESESAVGDTTPP